MTSIKQLPFADLYLGHPSLDDRYCALPGARVMPLPADAALRQDSAHLLGACRATLRTMPGATEFRQEHDGMQYRVAMMKTPHGEMFVLRKLAGHIGTLAELGIPPAYVRQLLERGMRGLFIVSGQAKTGKTTTACTLVRERLLAFGGVAVTAEVPPELPLEGAHGEGICYQTITGRDTRSFIESLRDASRWGAQMILIQELVEPEVAAEVLRASGNGALVITTMRAGDVVRTVSDLHLMADAHLGPDAARSLLADGLTGVLHQRLQQHGAVRQLETEFLQLHGATEVRRLLRDGRFEQLRHAMHQQVGSLLKHPGVMSLRENT